MREGGGGCAEIALQEQLKVGGGLSMTNLAGFKQVFAQLMRTSRPGTDPRQRETVLQNNLLAKSQV